MTFSSRTLLARKANDFDAHTGLLIYTGNHFGDEMSIGLTCVKTVEQSSESSDKINPLDVNPYLCLDYHLPSHLGLLGKL